MIVFIDILPHPRISLLLISNLDRYCNTHNATFTFLFLPPKAFKSIKTHRENLSRKSNTIYAFYLLLDEVTTMMMMMMMIALANKAGRGEKSNVLYLAIHAAVTTTGNWLCVIYSSTLLNSLFPYSQWQLQCIMKFKDEKWFRIVFLFRNIVIDNGNVVILFAFWFIICVTIILHLKEKEREMRK